MTINEKFALESYKTDDKNWYEPKLPPTDEKIRIKFKKMSETAILPTSVGEQNVGFDLYCDEDFHIRSGQTKKISTNIQLADMSPTDKYGNSVFFKIEGRSGLSAKGVFPAGGIIDNSYRGHIMVVLNCLNFDPDGFPREVAFKKGDRIAQLVVYKVGMVGEVVIEETDVVTETNRGSKGFGSSGK